MNAADVEALREPRSPWVCACCVKAATCPMLNDNLWRTVYATAKKPAPACTCDRWPAFARHRPDRHHARCALGNNPPQLMCLECVESVLQRHLTRDDLSPCLANYATFVLVQRATGAP